MIDNVLSRMRNSNSHAIGRAGEYLSCLWKYRHMYVGMVKKEFKGKYRNSILGYLWHAIFPFVSIIIYLIIFTTIFGKDMPNYWAYMASGVFGFTLFMSAMNGGSKVIIGKASMVTKSIFPKEILVFVHATVALITSLISYIILMIVMTATGIMTAYYLFMPVILMAEFIFIIGFTMLLSSVTVYFRDLAQIMSALSMIMFFATPVIYRSSAMNSEIMQFIFKVNPATYYINALHDVIYYGRMPDIFTFVMCFVLAFVMIVIGFIVFKKLEGKFAELL